MPKTSFEDAITFLDQVKMELGDGPHLKEFYDIMKAMYLNVDRPEVIRRVCTLFKGRKELALGFSKFLPEGYKIELPADGSGQPFVAVCRPPDQPGASQSLPLPGGAGKAGEAQYQFLLSMAQSLSDQAQEIQELRAANDDLKDLAGRFLITGRGGVKVYAHGNLLEGTFRHERFFNNSTEGFAKYYKLDREADNSCALSDFGSVEIRTLGGTKLDGIVSRCSYCYGDSFDEDDRFYEASFHFQGPQKDDMSSSKAIFTLWVQFGPIPDTHNKSEAHEMKPFQFIEHFAADPSVKVVFDTLVFHDTSNATRHFRLVGEGESVLMDCASE
eukprot:CAMPEP_0197438546 /NCGR_PEP_ID=MMETSP1175-20131217/5508_1 /TAXON_ID=1003142 /ORGANISM="Triceratium dubium, Strain CCMP147" /LENGTH=328 /DNA_ID=CAMNT_0042968297 /DNA_START=110 /DNA_END=1096 /DNA_ORIENTATION=+